MLLAPRGNHVEIVVTSAPDRYPLGEADDQLLQLADDVLESGASLLVTDVSAAMRFIHDRSSTIRFVACVPFTAGEVPVATLCLVDDEPHDFDSTEVRVLEAMARSASDALASPSPRRWFDLDSGLFSRHATTVVLDGLWRQAAAQKRTVGLQLVRTGRLPDDDSAGELLDDVPGPRMAIGALNRSTLVVCASAASRRDVSDRLDEIQDRMEECLGVEDCSRIVFEPPVPALTPDTLLSWAADLLVTDESEHAGTQVSVVPRKRARPDEA